MEKTKKINLIVIAILLATALAAGEFLGAHIIETRNEAAITFSNDYLNDYQEIINQSMAYDIGVVQTESQYVILDDLSCESNYLLINSINTRVNSLNTYIISGDKAISSGLEYVNLTEIKDISKRVDSGFLIYMPDEDSIILINKMIQDENVYYIVNEFSTVIISDFVESNDEYNYLYVLNGNDDILFSNVASNSIQADYKSFFKESEDNLYRFNGGYYVKQSLEIDNSDITVILFYNFIDSNELSMFYIIPVLVILLITAVIVMYEKTKNKYNLSKYIHTSEFKEYVNDMEDIVILLQKIDGKYKIINSSQAFNDLNISENTCFDNLIYIEDLDRTIKKLDCLYSSETSENFTVRLLYEGYGMISYYALPTKSKNNENNRIILSLVETKKIVDDNFRYQKFKENFAILKNSSNEIILEYNYATNRLLYFNNCEEVNGKSFKDITKELKELDFNSRLNSSNNFLLYLVYKEDIGEVRNIISQMDKTDYASGNLRLNDGNQGYNWFNMVACGVFRKDKSLNSMIARLVKIEGTIEHDLSLGNSYNELLNGYSALEEIKNYYDKCSSKINLCVLEFTNLYNLEKDEHSINEVILFINNKYKNTYISKNENISLVICMKGYTKDEFINIIENIINENKVVLSSNYKLMLHAACLTKNDIRDFDIPNSLGSLKRSVYQCVIRNEVISDES